MRLLKSFLVHSIFIVFSFCSHAQSSVHESEKLLMQGDYRKALEFTNNALKGCVVNTYERGKLFVDRGRAFQYLMVYDSAFSSFQLAIDNFESIKSINGLAESYLWLMEYYRSVSNIFQVRKMEVYAVKYLSQIPQVDILQALYFNRKGAYLNQFCRDSSQLAYQYIVKAFRFIENDSSYYSDYVRGNGWLDIAMYYADKGDEECFQYYKKSQKVWQKYHNQHYEAFSILCSANAHYSMKDYAVALQKTKKVYEVAIKNDFVDLQSNVMYLQYQIFDAIGDYKNALNCLRRYHETDFFSFPQNLYQMMLVGEKIYEEEVAQKTEELGDAKLQLMNKIAQNVKQERNIWATLAVITGSICVAGLFVYQRISKDKKVLQEAVKFNEILVKEVNHRVKNNLTFLKSMLYLKEKFVKDPYSREILKDFQNRIQAMAAVHTEMYSLDNVNGKVDLKTVLNKTIDDYELLLSPESRTIAFYISGELNEMELKDCLSLMLVLNELFVNSIKYVDKSAIEITIEFTQKSNSLEIMYKDNGDGFLKIEKEESEGFGMQMIEIMLKQINAKMSIKEDYLFIVK